MMETTVSTKASSGVQRADMARSLLLSRITSPVNRGFRPLRLAALLACFPFAAPALAEQTITINSDPGGSVFGNGTPPNGSSPSSADPNNNIVIINSNVSGDVIGGMGNNTNGFTSISGNSVTINGGTVGAVTGGQSFVDGANNTVTGNSVTINGGVYGGRVNSNSGAATVTNNTVTIRGNPTFGYYGSLYGGSIDGGSSGDFFTGNTLNLHASGLTLYELGYFQTLNFYLPTTVAAGDTVLPVGG